MENVVSTERLMSFQLSAYIEEIKTRVSSFGERDTKNTNEDSSLFLAPFAKTIIGCFWDEGKRNKTKNRFCHRSLHYLAK